MNNIILKSIFFIVYVFLLVITALSYELLPTPIALIILCASITCWSIQILIVKKVFLRVKNLRVYWLYNISSPFWSLWINGYRNEGSGSHNYFGYIIYIIGALLLTSFVLKKELVSRQNKAKKTYPIRKEFFWGGGIVIITLLSFLFCFKVFFDKEYVCGKDVVCDNNPVRLRNVPDKYVTGIVRSYDPQGNLYIEVKVKKGRKNGIQKSCYKNGHIKSEIPYKNGRMNGVGKWYYDGSQLQAVVHYKNDKQHGKLEEYYENGQLKTVQEYIEGLKNGIEKKYYANGQIKTIQYYKNNKEEGIGNAYYENGQLKAETQWEGGELNGILKLYDKNGKIYSEQLYKNGELVNIKNYDSR